MLNSGNFYNSHISGTCTNDRNCQASEVCDKGQCRDPCGIQGSCGINAFCSVQSHRKQCVCPQDFTGNPEVECVRIPSTCYSSSDCPQPMQCADGICMPPCSSDENCAINERCLQGLCMCKFNYNILKFFNFLNFSKNTFPLYKFYICSDMSG